MRVLLADDQPRVRSALRILLELEAGVRIVGEAGDVDELVAQIQATRPDTVLLDWELPGLEGSGALGSLRRECPELVIVALSARPEARHAARAAGINDFVSKTYPPEWLLVTVQRQVMNWTPD